MNDVNGYVARMNKSIDYQKFWFNKVDPDKFDRIIDFGCGNGTLGVEVLTDSKFASKEVVFYETSPVMRKLLTSKILMLPENYVERATVISNYELLKPLLQNERTLVVFSSVLHECYTFNTLPFKWEDLKCNYIVIRDMHGGDVRAKFSVKDRWKIFVHSRKKAFFDFFKRNDFSDKSCLHFLIKHLYEDNWDTEVLEDYFAVPWNEIETTLVDDGLYEIEHARKYNIPFLINYAKKHFDVEYDFYTHKDAIYRRVHL